MQKKSKRPDKFDAIARHIRRTLGCSVGSSYDADKRIATALRRAYKRGVRDAQEK